MAAGRPRGSRRRRVILPGVAELLRPAAPGLVASSERHASGREAHPQKITVYLSADEYLALERARLALCARGIRADRGRLVREAIAVLLADLDVGLDTSLVVQRLRKISGSATWAAKAVTPTADAEGATGDVPASTGTGAGLAVDAEPGASEQPVPPRPGSQ